MDGNTTLSGSGKIPGGKFENLSLNGSYTLTDDTVCTKVICNGRSQFKGSLNTKTIQVNGYANIEKQLTAKDIDINGHANISGHIGSGDISISGSMKCSGDITVDTLKIDGGLNCEGNIAGKKVVLNGKLTSNGDLSATSFKTNGIFNIDGQLKAKSVEIRLYLQSSAGQIKGDNITVKRGKDFLSMFSIKRLIPMLTADLIDGKEIKIADTIANVVRGDIIELGENCVIDLLEYRDHFTQGDNVTIREYRKI